MAEELVIESVRLTLQESAALAELAGRLHCSEGCCSEGLHQAQLGEGILSDVRGRATLARAARIAHLSEEECDEQLRLRGVPGPDARGGEGQDDADLFLTSLRRIRESVGSRRLVQAVDRVEAERQKPPSRR